MLDSIVRSITLLVVSLLLGWAAKVGLDIPSEALTVVVTAIIGGAFYTAVRLLEQRWPIVGQVLLGLGLARRTPVYVANGGKVIQGRVETAGEHWPPPGPPLR